MAKSALSRKDAIEPGRWGTVEYAVCLDGKCEAEAFFHVKVIREFGRAIGEDLQRKLMAVFEDISHHGYSRKMSPERKPIHGIKLEFRKKLVRMACFQHGRSWVLTNGFFKPGAQKKR